LNQIQRVFAYDFEGKRYDVGEKFGFVKTTIEFALQREDLRDEMMEFLKEVLSSSNKN
jgi:UTP--glucose-1-phosphate uridylyltransferase